MRRREFVATMLIGSAQALALAKESSADWAMNATIIDGCSCRLLCPCIFGSPATVGSHATHQHAGSRSCFFNAAFRVNKGHHGNVKLDGLKFWFAGDKGDAKTVELTFEPSATKEQRPPETTGSTSCLSNTSPIGAGPSQQRSSSRGPRGGPSPST